MLKQNIHPTSPESHSSATSVAISWIRWLFATAFIWGYMPIGLAEWILSSKWRCF